MWVWPTKWKTLGRKSLWDMHCIYDLVMCLCYFNGHINRHIEGVNGVHRGYGVGQKNLEGGMHLEFCLKKELCLSNTWPKRGKEEGHIQNGRK